MTTPTGRIVGRDLTLTRSFRAPIDDVWASVTEPDRTARWFGRWEGELPDIRVQLGFEEGAPWSDASIVACEPPRRLEMRTSDAAGFWHLELRLSEHAGTTELVLIHHLTDVGLAESAGPGWEYYLDNLVAARAGDPLPDFGDYYPAQKEHFAAQIRALE